MRRTACALVVVAACCVAPPAATASVFELYGFGARAVSMAGAGDASEGDYFALFYNPSNLLMNRDVRVGLGFDYVGVGYRIETTNQVSGLAPAQPGYNSGAHIGVSSPIGGIFNDKLAFGLAFYVPVGHVTRIDALDYRRPQAYLYHALGDALSVYGGLAYEFAPWLSVGVGARLMADLGGTAAIDLSLVDRRIERKDLLLELTGRVAPVLGISSRMGPTTRVGLTYRGPISVDYRIPIDVLVRELGALAFEIQGRAIYSPPVLSAGLAQEIPAIGLLVSAALTAQLWSHAPPPAASATLTLDDRRLRIDRGSNTPQNVIDVRTPRVSLDARDILIPKLGLEWRTTPWLALRCGAAYRPTPVPRATEQGNYLDAPALTATLGAGLSLEDPMEVHHKPVTVDVAAGLTHLLRRTVLKSDPADPFGATSFSGDALHLSVTLHHEF